MKYLIFAIILIAPSFCFALNIEDKLENPKLEQIAEETFSGIRCVECAGESIADSRAEIALDLRAVVRQKIKEGFTKQQVFDYVAQRYGDKILMRPPLKPSTYVLWFAPLVIFLFGLLAVTFSGIVKYRKFNL